MRLRNGRVRTDVYRGTRLVYAPPVKWYYLSIPYSSEIEHLLEPARNYEEDAVLVAPDAVTAFMLRLESFGRRIPVVTGDRQARRVVDERLLQEYTSASDRSGN